jgi:DNA-binding IclR family transcriptional regulator
MQRLNELFGPSKYLIVLDLFLQNSEDFMNLREIARRIDKNPASIMKVLPTLVSRNYIARTRIGAKVVAYRLNRENRKVKLLLEFLQKLEEENLQNLDTFR